MEETQRQAVLLFDGDCGFCTTTASLGRHLRLDCAFTSLQSVDVVALGVDPVKAQREVPLHYRNGTTIYGHAAIAGALKTGTLPWRTLGRVIDLGPVRHLSAWVYRAVSRHRRHLPGASPSCERHT